MIETRLRCAIAACIVAMPGSLSRADRARDDIDIAAAAASFREAREIAARDGGLLWGVDLDGPILLVHPATRSIVASQPDRGGALRRRRGVFVGTLPADVNIGNTALTWSGVRWTMLRWPLPEDRRARARLMLHELFHRAQPRIGLPAADPLNRHLDSRHGRTWLRLEWRALERALGERGSARRRAIADALHFRRHRHRHHPGAAAEEAALELHEGLAEYTGHKLSTRSAAELAARAAVGLREAERDAARGRSVARSFAYASGPAYGALLDALRPGWRSGLAPGADLAERLRDRLELPAGSPATARERAAAYDGDEVIASEARRHRERARQLAEHRARFVTGPLLILPLFAPRYGFDPDQVLPLDQLGAVHPELRLVDRWGVLEATRGALLVREGDRPVELRVPAPSTSAATRAAGDGWTLELAPGWAIAPDRLRGNLVVVKAPSDRRAERRAPAR